MAVVSPRKRHPFMCNDDTLGFLDALFDARAQPLTRLFISEQLRAPLFSDHENNGNDLGLDLTSHEASQVLFIFFRFLREIIGFHDGDLDLTGRYERRYRALMEKWNDFSRDIFLLAGSEQAHVLVLGDAAIRWGLVAKVFEYELRQKWCIPFEVAFDTLKRGADVVHYKLNNSLPKFQKSTLCMLPPELLEQIYLQASEPLLNRNPLQRTCRLFHQISSRFVPQSRTITNAPISPFSVVEERDASWAYTLALEGRSKALSHINHLVDHANLRCGLRHITVKSYWSPFTRMSEIILTDFIMSDVDPDYEGVYTRSLSRLLPICTTLSTLFLWGMVINFPFLQAILSIKTLRTLRISQCGLAKPFEITLSASQSLNSSITTTHLDICEGSRSHHPRIWVLIGFLRNLKGFRVHSPTLGFMLPEGRIFDACNPFYTVKRLQLDWVDASQAARIADWMEAAPRPLPLTHLKISVEGNIAPWPHMRFIEALRFAPDLQVLVLDGLIEASPELITAIAVGHGSLLGLTLILRDGTRQQKAALCRWPGSTWEYAPALAAFPQLRHFGWNAWVVNDGFDSSPAIMTSFENNFTGRAMPGGYDWEDDADFGLFFDNGWMGAPFAAYCPTLETFSIEPTKLDVYRVIRAPGGTPFMELEEDWHAVGQIRKMWNPTAWDNAWMEMDE